MRFPKERLRPCVSVSFARWVWLGLSCLRGSSEPPPQIMVKFVFANGVMRTRFPKRPSRNIESKGCSQQEAGTIPARLVAFARASVLSPDSPHGRPTNDGQRCRSSGRKVGARPPHQHTAREGSVFHNGRSSGTEGGGYQTAEEGTEHIGAAESSRVTTHCR